MNCKTWKLGFFVLASAGLCLLGLALDSRTMLAAYLAAAVTMVSVPLGALGVLMITYLVRARWTADLHGPLSAAVTTLPLAGLLFIPVLVGMPTIFPWVHDAPVENVFQSGYLIPWFFALRTFAYFAICSALGHWTVRCYGENPAMKRSASAGLVIYALIVSLAGIDWIESVQPDFHSSIYGLMFLTFVLLSGLAFGVVAILTTERRHSAPLSVYGGILLSTLLLWAYNHAMQYIIIWAGNLPDETVWYIERLRGGWGIALWSLYVFQFIVPFFALLSARVRSHRTPLLVLAGATLGLRFLEAIVLVVPALQVRPWLLLLDIPAAIVFTVSIWLMALSSGWARSVLTPVGAVQTK